jgi:dolichol-phosphate mannosyltransferase
LRLASLMGVVAFALALLGGVTAAGIGLANGHWMAGWGWVVLSVLLLGGAQLLCLGILGEYLGRTYGENKRRPLYFVRETLGFDEPFSRTPEARVAKEEHRSARAGFEG